MTQAARERDLQPRVELALLDEAGHSFAESMEAGLGELVVDYVGRWRGPLRESERADLRTSSQAAPESRWCVAHGR
jgi:hypothetical protein